MTYIPHMPSDLGDFQESVSEVVNKANRDTPRRIREESGLRRDICRIIGGAHAEHLHINLQWFIVLFKSFYDYGISCISAVCHQLCQVGSGHRSLESKAVAHTNSYTLTLVPFRFPPNPLDIKRVFHVQLQILFATCIVSSVNI
jgi:hypothetical protein